MLFFYDPLHNTLYTINDVDCMCRYQCMYVDILEYSSDAFFTAQGRIRYTVITRHAFA